MIDETEKSGGMMAQLLSKAEISTEFAAATWQRVVFSEFEANLTSRSRLFPCIFGVTGHKSDQLRYAFPDPLDADSVGPILKEYLDMARSLGRMTSLVLFGRPGPVQHIESYRANFWHLLDGLEALDEAPRRSDLPDHLDSERWEFCFDGEPIFVVCNSPAHVLRQSRRSSSFMVTFQPRWVFEGITDSDDPAMLKALQTVRKRLADYDAVEPAPYLGAYGAPDNREYQQYFIDDSNEAPVCPFRKLGQRDLAAEKEKGKVA